MKRKSFGDTMCDATMFCAVVFPKVFCIGLVVIAVIAAIAN